MAPLVYGEGLCKVIPAARDNLWEISWLTEQADLQPVGAEKWNSLCGYSWSSVWWGLKPLGHKYSQYAPNQVRQWWTVRLQFQDRCWSRGTWLICADSFSPTWYPIIFTRHTVLKEGEAAPAPHNTVKLMQCEAPQPCLVPHLVGGNPPTELGRAWAGTGVVQDLSL